MTDENQKFVEEMLKRAKDKKETEPQTRHEGVDYKEAEEITAKILGFKRMDAKKDESD